MSLIDDLRPFLQVGRIFGFGPYSMSSVDISLSKIGMMYSGFCCLFYVYLSYLRFDGLVSTEVEVKLRFLTILRTIFTDFVIFVDILVSIRWHHKLQATLACMQRYDVAVKLEPTPKTNSTRYWCGLVIIVAYFLSLGWVTFIYETWRPLEHTAVYVLLYLSTTFGIIKFAAIVASLLHRFRHLNRLLKTDWPHRKLNLHDAWCLHGCLIAAAEELNALYSAQLLLWIAGLTFNIISRIYVFCETDALLNVAKLLREGGLAVALLLLLILLVGVCHVTAAEANKVGTIVFSLDSTIFRRRLITDVEDSIQIGLYFLFHQFNFSAASGFLRVDLPLLQTIAGTMTTYLVILKAPG